MTTVADLYAKLGTWIRVGDVVGRCEGVSTRLVKAPVGERVQVVLSIRGLGARRGRNVRGWLDDLAVEAVFAEEAGA